MPIVKCDYCGEEKKTSVAQFKNNNHHFCNFECRGNYLKIYYKGNNNPAWKGGKGREKIEFNCIDCGEKITQKKRNFNRKKELLKNRCPKCSLKIRFENCYVKINCFICGISFKKKKYFVDRDKHHICKNPDCKSKFRSWKTAGENNGHYGYRGSNPKISISLKKKYSEDEEYRKRFLEVIRNPERLQKISKANWKEGQIKFKCDYCGKEKERYSSQISKHNFCSKKCAHEWWLKNYLPYHLKENHPNWIHRALIKCDYCGKEKEILFSRKNSHNFCNFECFTGWLKDGGRGRINEEKNQQRIRGIMRRERLTKEQAQKEYLKRSLGNVTDEYIDLLITNVEQGNIFKPLTSLEKRRA